MLQMELPAMKTTPSWKELLVLLPITGYALAMIFDVGFFLGLNFNLFSLMPVRPDAVRAQHLAQAASPAATPRRPASTRV